MCTMKRYILAGIVLSAFGAGAQLHAMESQAIASQMDEDRKLTTEEYEQQKAQATKDLLFLCAMLLEAADEEVMLAQMRDAIARGADVSARNERGQSALCCAISAGKANIAALLMSCGVSLSGANKVDCDVWQSACVKGVKKECMSGRMMQLLMRSDLFTDVASPECQNAAQHVAMQAIQSGRLDIFRTLVKQCNVDVNVADACGRTFLMHAASNGFADTARWLIDRGARLDTKNKKNESVLQVAFFEAPDLRSRVAVMLLAYGATELSEAELPRRQQERYQEVLARAKKEMAKREIRAMVNQSLGAQFSEPLCQLVQEYAARHDDEYDEAEKESTGVADAAAVDQRKPSVVTKCGCVIA